jgi:hypothetical protein
MSTITPCILVLSELTPLGGFEATHGPTAEQLYNEANGAYDRGEAIAQYQEAPKRDSNNSMVRLNLALAWYKQAEFEKASAELQSLRKEHTDSRSLKRNCA